LAVFKIKSDFISLIIHLKLFFSSNIVFVTFKAEIDYYLKDLFMNKTLYYLSKQNV